MADERTTEIWVLAYILRFPNEPGEWAQVHSTAFASENEARAYMAAIKAEPGSYQICKVRVQEQAHVE